MTFGTSTYGTARYGTPGWVLFARRGDGTRAAQLDDHGPVTMSIRHNDVSTWSLTVPGGSPEALALSEPGAAVDITDGGVTVLSGPVVRRERVLDVGVDTLTVTGVDDTVWLHRRLAHPQPATPAPPYNTADYDIRTGATSTVFAGFVDANAGPGAIEARRVPGLTVTDLGIGPTITGRGRWQTLLELFQSTTQGVGFRIRANTFETYLPTAAPVVFDPDRGNVGNLRVVEGAPEATYTFVAGQGEGIARQVVEGASDALSRWGRIERFADRRDTDDTAELTQAIGENLRQGDTGVALEPVDTPGSRWREDYQLGDTVTARLDGVEVPLTVTQVVVDLDADGAVIAPHLGAEHLGTSNDVMARLLVSQRRLGTLIRNMQRS